MTVITATLRFVRTDAGETLISERYAVISISRDDNRGKKFRDGETEGKRGS